MNLFDLLMNRKNDRLYNDMEAVNNYADMQKAEALKSKLKPVLVPLQMDEAGGLDTEATNRVQNYINNPVTEPNLWQRIVGRDITTDTQLINPETNQITLDSTRVHEPGYLEKVGQGLKRGLDDILGGYSENRTQNFSTDNWNNNYLDNGNKKGLAYKLGEGLGSFAKLAESPLGRSLLVGGIVGATGGDGLQALSYGAQTGMLNQANRMKDQMYRNELAKMGFDTSGIRGYIGDDTFNKIFQSKQLQDNAEYRNALLEINKRNQEADNQLAQQKLARQEKQDAIDTGIKLQELNLKRQKLEDDRNKKSGGLDNLTAVSNQLKRFEDTFKTMPNKLESNTLGRFRNATGLQTKEEANFNSQRTLLFNKIARDLGGEKGVLSDQDIKRIEKALPDYTDSYEQKQAKMSAVYALLEDRLAVEGASMQDNADADPLGIL